MPIRLTLFALSFAFTALAQREELVSPAVVRDVRGDTDDTLVLPAGTVTATPLLQRQGLWSSAELLLEGQYLLHESIFLRGSLGAGGSTLWWRSDGQATWFGEAVATAEIVFRVREAFSGWVGAELRVPFGPWGAARLTPTTRVCARLGLAATWVRDWDLFAELQVLDRGDLSVPGTTIPAVDGGFDQRVLMIGVTHRFDLPRPPRVPDPT